MEGSKKIQSMKNQKRVHFVYNMILYSLTSLITFIFFFYTFWFPSIYRVASSNISLFINAKVFFIVGNLIVLFLVRESKVSRSQNAYLATEFYDEYVSKSRSINPNITVNNYDNKREEEEEEESIKKITPRIDRRKKKKKKKEDEETILKIEKKKENIMRKSKSKSNLHLKRQENKLGLRASKSEVWSINEDNNTNEITAAKPKEEQLCISTEDLNKRVEAFIARVNKQRLLES